MKLKLAAALAATAVFGVAQAQTKWRSEERRVGEECR